MAFYSVRGIVKESAPLLSALILFEIIGGNMLHHNLDYAVYPILLMLVPVVNGLGGNIGSILGARLSSGLHLGTIRPNLRGSEVSQNIGVAMVLAAFCFTLAPVFIWLFAPLMGVEINIAPLLLLTISILTGSILIFIVILIGLGSSWASFRLGGDPDNVVIPILTAAADLAGMLSLVLVVALIGI